MAIAATAKKTIPLFQSLNLFSHIISDAMSDIALNWGLVLSTIAVLLGVVAEGAEYFAIARRFAWSEDFIKFLEIIGFSILVVGLAGEFIFSHELSARSDALIAAQQRKIVALSPRDLSSSERKEICADLSGESGPVVLSQISFDEEAYRLGDEIKMALSCATIAVVDNRTSATIGVAPVFGITVTGSNGGLVQKISDTLRLRGHLKVSPPSYPAGSASDPPASIYIGGKPIEG